MILCCAILYHTILCYTILYYSWDKRLYHACRKLMLESKIKEFYQPGSEDSLQSTHIINQEGFFGSLFAGFVFIPRDYYFGAPSDNCFCNIKKVFLEHKKGIFSNHNVYDNRRCLYGSKIST